MNSDRADKYVWADGDIEITSQGNEDDEPSANLSLETDSDRGAVESTDPTIDTIIDRSAAASVVIADEIRQRVQALVKKKYPGHNS